MLESTLQSNAERPLLGQPNDEMALRVCGGPRDGHIVRLASPRCSVGSSDRCTLRLRGPGIRPLHCVILRGTERTVVRRWSPDTLLNGRDFTDAPLVMGDQLTIGPILFEIVSADSVASPSAALRGLAGDLPPEPDHVAKQDLDRRLEELTLRQGELDAAQAEIGRREQALSIGQEQFRAECETINQNRARQQQHLDDQAAELAARETRLTARETQFDEREAEIADRERDRERALPTGQDQYQTAADVIYGSGSEPADQIVEPAEEIGFEAVSEEAPLSAAAVLRRLGADMPVDEDDQSPKIVAPTIFRSPQPVAPAALPRHADGTAAADDDDESVENYMARLMERVGVKQRGLDSSRQATTDRPAAPEPAAAPTIQPATRPAAHNDDDKPKLERMVRRSTPELSADLSRMRELANENVRTVLDVHFRRKLYYMTIGKASVAVASFLAGLILLWWSAHGAPIAFYLATISFVITAIWMLQYAIAVGYLVQGRTKSDGTSRGNDANATGLSAAVSLDANAMIPPVVPDEHVAAYQAIVAAADRAKQGEAAGQTPSEPSLP